MKIPDTGIITGVYIIFYQGDPIDHGKHVPVPVDELNGEIEYNSACTTGMYLSHFRILINAFLKKDPYIVPKENPPIILVSKSDVCMDKNGKDTNHTRHIYRGVHFVRNNEN